jgi:GntR family transcriptional regulator
MLETQSEVTLYQQIYDDIKHKIGSGEYREGQALPSEAKLCEIYGVSRVTVRKALEELENAGVIERIRGKGPIVARPKLRRNMSSLGSLQDQIREAGMTPSSVISEIRRVSAEGQIAEILQAQEGEPLVCYRRLQMGNGVPLADQRVYLREKYCPGFDPMDLQTQSLYDILEKRYSLNLNYCDQTITNQRPTAGQIESLHLTNRNSLLFTKRLTVLTNGEPVEYTETAYVPDRYELHMRLYR